MSLTHEDEILIRCSSVTVDAESRSAVLGLLRKELDWQYILDASIQHAVSPLLYRGLLQVTQGHRLDEFIPAQVAQALDALYQNNVARNQRLYRVVEQIAKVFEQAGVPLMGLKDLQLAWEVYPDIGLRPMGDLDLLIRQEDYEKASACMLSLGFNRLPASETPYLHKYAWEQQFQRQEDNVWVDLQWNILQIAWDVYQEGCFDFEIERMWSGAVELGIGNSRLLVPRPEDMLFHLCLHLEGHRYSELVLFCDLVELLRFYDHSLDWNYFVGLAQKYQVESSIYYILLLLGRLFQVQIPPGALEELRPVYFKGDLYEPLFGNLASLHLSLDEINQVAHPPQEVMSQYETTVRQQVVGAIQLYAEIDQFLCALHGAGGNVAGLQAPASPRIFPDPVLPAFGPFSILVVDRDQMAARHALAACGFEAEEGVDGLVYRKSRPFVSSDPLLQGHLLNLAIKGSEKRDWQMGADEQLTSKKDLAMHLLKSRAGGNRVNGAEIEAVVNLVILPPEEIALALGSQLAGQEQYRLFSLVDLLNFLTHYTGPLDAQKIALRAEKLDNEMLIQSALLLAGELIDDDRLQFDDIEYSALAPLKLLGWARYGPESLALYTDLKGPFYYLLSLFTLDRAKTRAQYLLASLFGDGTHQASLPGLAWSVVKRGFQPKEKDSGGMANYAYWTEAEKPRSIETEQADRYE